MEATDVSFSESHLVAGLPGDRVVVDGCRVRMSRREAETLARLLANHNQLARRYVPRGFPTRPLDVCIGRLRRTLGRTGMRRTHHLMGYRFVEDGTTNRHVNRQHQFGGRA